MKKLLPLLVLFLASIFVTYAVRAQETVKFSVVEIGLWPEYDRAEMLVIYRMQLDEDTIFPVELSINIPASAGNPNAVASGISLSTITDVNYSRTVAGNNANITFMVTEAFIQFEYYDSINITRQVRNYEYVWLSDFDISVLWIRINLPESAHTISLPEGFGDTTLYDDGLINYELIRGDVAAGESIYVPINYSVGEYDRQLYVWLLAGVGASLIGMGSWRYFKLHSPVTKYFVNRKNRKNSKRNKNMSKLYCHNCGWQAKYNDKFCRNCGVELRLNQ